MKTRRSGMAAIPGSALRCFREFLDDAIAFQLRNVVDEEHAVDVVDLVLQAGASNPVGLDLLRLSGDIIVATRTRDGRSMSS